MPLRGHPVMPLPCRRASHNGSMPGTQDDAEPSPCPACGADPEQSTDPRNMSRSVCYCGHPRYYDYRHADGTCPCQA
jgi:hypothetical protein